MIKINGKNVSRIPINGKETLRVMQNGQQLWSGSGLPAGYTLLEYIESTGQQYIDTGFKPNGNTMVEMDAQMNQYSTGFPAFFGAFGLNDANAFTFLDPSSGGGTNDYYAYYYGTSNTISNKITDEMFERGIIIADKGTLNYHGITRSVSDTTFESNIPMYLFGANNNGTFYYKSSMKLYSCKIYDNGALIRDYIPCMNSNGICGLFDKVNKKFYSSANSTTFIGA